MARFREIIRRNTYLITAFRYLRYFIYRYIYKHQFTNFELFKRACLMPFPGKVSFFGYYTISPENFTKSIIYCTVNSEHVRGSTFEEANIVLYKGVNRDKKISQTYVWNWQQGCMLQWLPPLYDRIIFNDYDQQRDIYFSKVVDTNGNITKVYSKPIYSVSQTGKYGLTLNFDRLAVMRPDYGYFNRKNTELPPDSEDGIWYLDFETGESRLIISLEKLAKLFYSNTMRGAKHKVNHIDINPSGIRFMFLHRWVGPLGRFTRLITANVDGTDIFILNGDTMTSHSCWVNDNEIISFCYVEGRGIDYYRFKDRSKDISIVSAKLPQQDGHPSISPCGKYMITDTYPDKARMSYLLLYEFLKDKLTILGRFYQPLKYHGERRIDLHPKWSLDGKDIFFESGHKGKRCLYKIYLDGIKEDSERRLVYC